METILDYLERTVNRHPDREAVDDGDTCYTWQELKELSRQIGSAVTEALSSVCNPVPVFMEKRADTVAAFLGVAYAGNFYILINPEYPEERIRKLLFVLQAKVAVTEKKLTTKLSKCGFTGKTIEVEAVKHTTVQQDLLDKIRIGMEGRDYLYGIFTSGSTGFPKSVVVSHQSVIGFITDFTTVFPFGKEDVLANQTPFDFDVSVKDIYTSVFTGAKLVLVPKEMFTTPPRLLDYLCEKEATVLIWAVSALCMITTLRGLEYRIPKAVRRIFFSGEVMPMVHLKQWRKALPDTEFVNLYGPTEVTCNCTYYKVTGDESEKEGLPIGQAFPGRHVFLLDQNQKEIVSPGMRGEICVGGGLSSGYYRDVAATEERFIRTPLSRDHGGMIYRTGDMGYWGDDRKLYFVGRKDHQIKRMGYRIELEEIEREIGRIPGINRVCCLYNQATKRLTAFYMGDVKEARMREWVKQMLPYYMAPSSYIRLPLMPLNKNGKTDRSYLQNYIRKEERDAKE